MIWAILGIAGVFFFIISPGFRVFVLMLAAVAGFLIFQMIETDRKRHEERQQQQQAAARAEAARWGQIKPSEIELRDLSFAPGYRPGSDRDYTVEGAIKNNARKGVTTVRLSVTALDCKPDQSDAACEVIGRSLAELRTDVPPSEVRAVKGFFKMANLPKAHGQTRLTYAVTDIQAKW